jgi:hypothetical protein
MYPLFDSLIQFSVFRTLADRHALVADIRLIALVGSDAVKACVREAVVDPASTMELAGIKVVRG